jgi:orotidine-5'-phosphate decarboxylase
MAQVNARDKLIVALDLPSADEARAMVATLDDAVDFYKIGMELTYAGGLPLARELVAAGKKVFLDLKLHDIPNTVARATAQVAELGATFLTIHAYPQTMKAARGALGGSDLKLLAVTVMTSYDDADLAEAGYAYGVKELVARRARQAREAGVHGLVLSPEEAPAMRAALGPDVLLVTPGVRPAGAALGDQKRVMTPARAIAGGADHLVVGRPITQAPDPRAAAQAIVAEIEAA